MLLISVADVVQNVSVSHNFDPWLWRKIVVWCFLVLFTFVAIWGLVGNWIVFQFKSWRANRKQKKRKK